MSSTVYIIEKGIPIQKSRIATSIYPFAQMEVGDSFLIPCGPKSARQNAIAAVERLGMDAVTRKQLDGSIRVWRVA